LASESAAAGKEEVRVVNQGLDGDPIFRSKIMAKNFKELREKMSPESRERSRLLAAKYRAEMPLDELREAREMTQVHLARILKVNQAAVSKMERRADMYISTLQDFIKAMGGELKIIARFPDGTVEINQFESVKKAAVGS
jgi:DNA-binding transcriptional regulator YiaG